MKSVFSMKIIIFLSYLAWNDYVFDGFGKNTVAQVIEKTLKMQD